MCRPVTILPARHTFTNIAWEMQMPCLDPTLKGAAQEGSPWPSIDGERVVDLCALIGVATRCCIARCGVPEITTHLTTNYCCAMVSPSMLQAIPGIAGLDDAELVLLSAASPNLPVRHCACATRSSNV